MLDFIKQLDNLINENIPRMHGDFLNVVAMTSTKLVSFYFLALLFVFLIVAIKSKKDVIYLYVGSCLIVLINYILKNTIQRQRPTGVRLIVEKGYSFPSAHAMLSAFIYGFIAYLIYKKINNSKRKYVVLLAFSLLILWIGFTRIYLGVHYFSDVIVGATLGSICLYLYIKFVYNKNLLFKEADRIEKKLIKREEKELQNKEKVLKEDTLENKNSKNNKV